MACGDRCGKFWHNIWANSCPSLSWFLFPHFSSRPSLMLQFFHTTSRKNLLNLQKKRLTPPSSLALSICRSAAKVLKLTLLVTKLSEISGCEEARKWSIITWIGYEQGKRENWMRGVREDWGKTELYGDPMSTTIKEGKRRIRGRKRKRRKRKRRKIEKTWRTENY